MNAGLLMCSYVCIVAGFKEQIYDVYRYLPPATQVVLFSATLPHEILEMTSKFMTDPIRILVKRLVPIHSVQNFYAILAMFPNEAPDLWITSSFNQLVYPPKLDMCTK